MLLLSLFTATPLSFRELGVHSSNGPLNFEYSPGFANTSLGNYKKKVTISPFLHCNASYISWCIIILQHTLPVLLQEFGSSACVTPTGREVPQHQGQFPSSSSHPGSIRALEQSSSPHLPCSCHGTLTSPRALGICQCSECLALIVP